MREADVLEQCLRISKEAYEQEISRQKTIVSKADYLMKFHTLLVAILNLSLPLIVKYAELENLGDWRIFYGFAMACLLLGIIFTLLIQKPRKITMSQLGTTVLKEVQKTGKDICAEEWVYKSILLLDKRTLSVEKANNGSVKWIIASYIAFIVSILLMGIFFYSVMQ